VKRDWCQIHGREHTLALACGACLKLFVDGERTCHASCNGPSRKNWLPDDQQDTWRCVSR